MLFRVFRVFFGLVVVWLMLPHEPDVGYGRPGPVATLDCVLRRAVAQSLDRSAKKDPVDPTTCDRSGEKQPLRSSKNRERRVAGRLHQVLALVVAFVFMSAIPPAKAQTYRDADASAHIGETATIEGVVQGTFVTVNHSQFLDFGGTYPQQNFSAVIWSPDAHNFGPVTSYRGKHVAVTGRITRYRGKPEMVLTTADTLKVLP